MKDVTEFEVKQTRIFPVDGLPMPRLITPAVSNAFRERFGWGGAEAPEGEIVFQPGVFPNTEAKDAIVIKSLQMNERRMVLTVIADSSGANQVHKGLMDFFAEVAGWTPAEPLILTEDTTCTATLDFDWDALLSPAMRKFLKGTMNETISAHSISPPEVRGLHFAVRIAYPEVPTKLQEHGVALSDKTLTVEPRVQTPPSERRYYTSSPTDSDTHLQLLEQLERALT